ncbi:MULTISPECIES: hypothetical protein [unclassified Mesorhizobium]|nr:hypothetical protein X743_26440 [Mesorhizobium sp. LNHC252B00]
MAATPEELSARFSAATSGLLGSDRVLAAGLYAVAMNNIAFPW